MRILVLGAGMMGRAIAYDLTRRAGIDEIILADRDRTLAEEVADWLRDRRVTPRHLDVSAPRAVRESMQGCAVAVSAVPYFFNLSLARIAIKSKTHFCDLGGNNRIVAGELALDSMAKGEGVTVIPDCGLAPGLVNILTAAAIEDLETVHRVTIRVGGLPQHPHPPLDYQIVFSPHGLLNEYMEPATILRDGEIIEVPSLTGHEEISFSAPYEHLEAFHTSGGSSTLPQTMHNRVQNLDYKTIRYPGHMEKASAMAELGFFDTAPRSIDGIDVVPRELAVHLLAENLSYNEPDIVLLRVNAFGTLEGRPREVRYQMIDRYEEETGLSAMMRTTGFPIAQIAYMLATERISQRGALPQEVCVPTQPFLAGLQKRGLAIERTVHEG
jgi:lysine 6-dehydrogenase